MLHPPDSDSGVAGQPATFTDLATNDSTPTFYGETEADAFVAVAADAAAIAETTTPADGQWLATSVVNLLDGLRAITRDCRRCRRQRLGATGDARHLHRHGRPSGGIVTLPNDTDYNLFAAKPADGNGPTPPVTAISIAFTDDPAREGAFQYGALNAIVAAEPGHYLLVGDNNGAITPDSVTVEQGPGTATVTLNFDDPIPDDHYALVLSDDLVDDPGNALDGDINAAEPTFPSAMGSRAVTSSGVHRGQST